MFPTPFPTPTAYPTLNAIAVEVPDLDLWTYTDESIQLWNQVNSSGFLTFAQLFIIMVLVIAIGMMLTRFVKKKADDTGE